MLTPVEISAPGSCVFLLKEHIANRDGHFREPAVFLNRTGSRPVAAPGIIVITIEKPHSCIVAGSQRIDAEDVLTTMVVEGVKPGNYGVFVSEGLVISSFDAHDTIGVRLQTFKGNVQVLVVIEHPY